MSLAARLLAFPFGALVDDGLAGLSSGPREKEPPLPRRVGDLEKTPQRHHAKLLVPRKHRDVGTVLVNDSRSVV